MDSLCLRRFCLSLCLSGGIILTGHAETVIKIDGSSTVYPITEAVAEEVHQSKNDVNVNVVISGTGGGFAKFCRGETDISDASRPISRKEMDLCRESGVQFIELPVGFDALTVAVNPKNDFVKSLTPGQLRKLWEPAAQGKITNWNQVDASFPDVRIRLYGPGNNSGTFDYFTEAIVGKAKQSRTDYIASEDDYLLVRGVSRNAGAIGYFGYAYYVDNKRKLKAVPIDAGKGAVLPAPENVENGRYTPLSRPIFIYVAAKSIERAEVREFVDYYMKNGARIVKLQNYVPLPANAYAMNLKRVGERKLGTVFGGSEGVSMRIEDVLAREGKN